MAASSFEAVAEAYQRQRMVEDQIALAEFLGKVQTTSLGTTWRRQGITFIEADPDHRVAAHFLLRWHTTDDERKRMSMTFPVRDYMGLDVHESMKMASNVEQGGTQDSMALAEKQALRAAMKQQEDL
eukprot:TRINITY_DN69870_c0_g1_i1.p1 TRINITY_DN69870_c0_g1~~TRINITY_DN69870_c0_g1_i1.p1  ORF type:complete len:127 (-),score=28.30 TRINITY_DN69870_c0_g1_i1:65-445(-)